MPVVAIDGPGGAGKSTLARALAKRLGMQRLDTGAMYRAVALSALRSEIDPEDGVGLAALARSLVIDVNDIVHIGGEDVTEEIRSDEVNAVVSRVSAHSGVREVLVAAQREWVRRHGGGVVEGRDIGSVVFPDADRKFYLTAHSDERARRRADELGAVDNGAIGPPDLAAVFSSIAARDHLDTTRASSPLVACADAIVIDSTDRSAEEVLAEVLGLL